jgi:hypothetical protein
MRGTPAPKPVNGSERHGKRPTRIETDNFTRDPLTTLRLDAHEPAQFHMCEGTDNLDHQAPDRRDATENFVLGDILDDTPQGFDRHHRPHFWSAA